MLQITCKHFYTNAQKLPIKWLISIWDRKLTREIPEGLMRSWTRVSRVVTQRFPHLSSKAPLKSTRYPTGWWEWSKPLSSNLHDQSNSVYSESYEEICHSQKNHCVSQRWWNSESCVKHQARSEGSRALVRRKQKPHRPQLTFCPQPLLLIPTRVLGLPQAIEID